MWFYQRDSTEKTNIHSRDTQTGWYGFFILTMFVYDYILEYTFTWPFYWYTCVSIKWSFIDPVHYVLWSSGDSVVSFEFELNHDASRSNYFYRNVTTKEYMCAKRYKLYVYCSDQRHIGLCKDYSYSLAHIFQLALDPIDKSISIKEVCLEFRF